MAIKFLNAQTIEGQLTVINTSGGDEALIVNPSTGSFSIGDIQELGNGATITGDADKIQILNTGNVTLTVTTTNEVGIGKLPDYKLDVQDFIGIDGVAFVYEISGATPAGGDGILQLGDVDGNARELALLDQNSTEVVRIQSNAVGINTTTFTRNQGSAPDLVVADSSDAPGVLDLYRSGNVVAGDTTGTIQFSLEDDSFYTIAQIKSHTAVTSGSGISGGGVLTFSTSGVGSGNSPAERMRINQIGQVGMNITDFSTLYGTTPDLRVGSVSGANNPGVIDILRKDGNVVAGETTGILQFSVDDDNNYCNAQIQVESASTAQTGNSGGGIMTFKTTAAGTGSVPTKRMEINQIGNVAIGGSPTKQFIVRGNGGPEELLYVDSNAGEFAIGDISGLADGAYIIGNSAEIDFYNNGSFTARSDSNNNFLIGSSLNASNSRLMVSGEIDVVGGDGMRMDGNPWAYMNSPELSLGDWDGQDYETKIYYDGNEIAQFGDTNSGDPIIRLIEFPATVSSSTGSSLNPVYKNKATNDTLGTLCVDTNGKIVRGEQEATWKFTAAQLNQPLGITLLNAPGANKAVVVTESDWMIEYNATGAISSGQNYEIRQESNTSPSAIISVLPATRINEILSNNQGTPANPSYGFCTRDVPLQTRTYKTNVPTTLHRLTGASLPSGVISISIKLKYRVFDGTKF